MRHNRGVSRPEADCASPFPIPGDETFAAIETDRDLERLFDGEPDEEVTILIEDEGVPRLHEPGSSVFDETPGSTEVMVRPPIFAALVRVPAPGLPMLITDAPESEPHTLTGLHGLHDLIADDSQHMPRMPVAIASIALEDAATPIFYTRVRTSTQKMPQSAVQKMPEADLPSVVVETAGSIAPLAFDVSEPMPREIVLRSVLSSSPPPLFDDARTDATTVLPRAPARRRSPMLGAAIGLAAALRHRGDVRARHDVAHHDRDASRRGPRAPPSSRRRAPRSTRGTDGALACPATLT